VLDARDQGHCTGSRQDIKVSTNRRLAYVYRRIGRDTLLIAMVSESTRKSRSWRVPRLAEPGSFHLALGFGLIAVSGTAVLAIGPRIISHHDFSGISLAWVVSVVFGFGVATPTEQLISRRTNAGDSARGRSPSYWLVVLAGFTIISITVLTLFTNVGRHYPLLLWSLLAVLGWSLVSPRRGELLGHQAMPAYALSMIVEGVLRVALVALAAIGGAPSEFLLGLSIGLPIVVSAAVAHMTLVRHKSPRTAVGVAPGFEHLSFMAIAFGYQVSINLPPLAMSWKVSAHNSDFVGAFVVANSWMRVPTILMGTITVAALAELSRVVPTGSVIAFRAVMKRSGLACLTLALGGAIVCLVLARPATTLLYGERVNMPSYSFVCLAGSTILAILCSWLSTPLMALRHSMVAARLWGLCSVLIVGALVVLPLHAMVTLGLVVPLAVATAFLAVAARVQFLAWIANQESA
jgi:O-antigen/teichoic acid export membrane protein